MWSYTSTSPYVCLALCLRNRDNFAFIFKIINSNFVIYEFELWSWLCAVIPELTVKVNRKTIWFV
jgi:hypothetical protein